MADIRWRRCMLKCMPWGLLPPLPPRSDVSGVEALRSLWMNTELDAVEVREITVQRTFADFEDFWTTSMMSATVSQTIANMAPGDAELLKMRMRARLPADVAGRITHGARANAIMGRVPKQPRRLMSPLAQSHRFRDVRRMCCKNCSSTSSTRA